MAINAGDVILHVPVPGYVYKYCRKVFGEKGTVFNYWRLTVHHKEGKVIYSMLERVPYRYEKYERNQCILPILIPSKMARTKGCYLTQENINIFIDYVKDVILEEIVFFHSGIQSRLGIKTIDKFTVDQYYSDKKIRVLRLRRSEAHKFFWQKNIISDILARYDITEDEISYDSIVKHLQRHSPFHYSA